MQDSSSQITSGKWKVLNTIEVAPPLSAVECNLKYPLWQQDNQIDGQYVKVYIDFSTDYIVPFILLLLSCPLNQIRFLKSTGLLLWGSKVLSTINSDLQTIQVNYHPDATESLKH